MSIQEAVMILTVHKEFFGDEVHDALEMAIDALEFMERREDDLK